MNIDELQAQIDLETACRYYGVDPGELHSIGQEIRTRCFLNCGKPSATGDRAIALDGESPVKRWRCHQYGCGKGGNLVTLCDLMKPGTNGAGQQPRGTRFKEIRDDLRRMLGDSETPLQQSTNAAERKPVEEEPQVNVPLAVSPNARARELTTLDERFLVIPDQSMNRDAAAYIRNHSFLTPEVCRQARCGYLPRPGGSSDRRGGTLQGMWVYGYADETGEPLTWFGRNLRYEQQQQQWTSGGRQGKEPAKFHFVKGFHRGLEIYGQHEWNREDVQEQIRELGALVVVEGPNDRIALKSLGITAFAICGNIITREQAEKASGKAREIGVPVGVMFDLDSEGENGARQSLPLLAEYGPVLYVWSSSIHDGKFKGRQPESLSRDESGLIWKGSTTTD
ncbi:MAG: toprim domain-containing protein [Planctomycetales bacterium]